MAVLVSTVVAGACSGTGDAPASRGAEEGPDTSAQPSPTSAEGQSYDTARVVVHMGEHFWALADAHDAAIAGNLDSLRDAADRLASHEPAADLPPAAQTHMATLLERSRAAARVETLADAG
ncbi:MAG: hypothetical protein HKN73_06640, partial [Gemmatimonadetes bacterium]|nr:hypothetical protein [Gemmatimonadota bacterium]